MKRYFRRTTKCVCSYYVSYTFSFHILISSLVFFFFCLFSRIVCSGVAANTRVAPDVGPKNSLRPRDGIHSNRCIIDKIKKKLLTQFCSRPVMSQLTEIVAAASVQLPVFGNGQRVIFSAGH